MNSYCTYFNHNANPKKKKTGDCVIRALATFTGKDYEEVYRALFEISLKTGYILNDKRVYEKYAEQIGLVKHKQPRKLDGTKYLVGELPQIAYGQRAIVSLANHLTCIDENGRVIDIWDCRRKTIGNYWTY